MELRNRAIIIAEENTNDVILCVRRVQNEKLRPKTIRCCRKGALCIPVREGGSIKLGGA